MSDETEKELRARIEALELDVKVLKQAAGTSQCSHSYHSTEPQWGVYSGGAAARRCPRCAETWKKWTTAEGGAFYRN